MWRKKCIRTLIDQVGLPGWHWSLKPWTAWRQSWDTRCSLEIIFVNLDRWVHFAGSSSPAFSEKVYQVFDWLGWPGPESVTSGKTSPGLLSIGLGGWAYFWMWGERCIRPLIDQEGLPGWLFLWAAGAVDGWRRRRVAAPTTFYSANHHQCKVENRVDRTTLSTLFAIKCRLWQLWCNQLLE